MDSEVDSPRKKVKLSTEDDAPTDILLQDTTFTNQEDTTQQQSNKMLTDNPVVETDKEAEVGITCYLGPESKHFKALLKKRYTDFLVNEILPDGTVLHLQSLKPRKAVNDQGNPEPEPEPEQEQEAQPGPEKALNGPDETWESTNGSTAANRTEAEAEKDSASSALLSEQDKATLGSHFGEEVGAKIVNLYEKIMAHPDRKASYHPTVESSSPITDRTLRTQMHQDIRRIFQSRIESSTTKEGVMVLTAAPPLSKQKERNSKSNRRGGPQGRQGRLGWEELGGEYLHFTIYKENKDTMEVISYLARELRMAPKGFQFAGTKDRRGVTVQRASVYRVEANRLASLNRSLRYANVGDFTYEKQGLELGDLGGNEFIITLRDCEWSSPEIQNLPIEDKVNQIKASVTQSMHDLHARGYLNYFGLQRFGTFASRTDSVGLKLLQGDYKGACDLILSFPPSTLAAAQANDATSKIGFDDKARAEAINMFLTTDKAGPALDKLPRKFSAEQNVIRHLSKNRKDYMGAIMMIPRNLRLMYSHAYQSLIWNLAVSHRWTLHGDQVVEGDLVMVDEHLTLPSSSTNPSSDTPLVDADGELIIAPAPHDTANNLDTFFRRARALTATEAASGRYTIHDIVLPLPGFDVLYPTACPGMQTFYKDIMARDSLDPENMRRAVRDFSLSGSYRKMLGRIEGPSNTTSTDSEEPAWSVDVKTYTDHDDDSGQVREKQFVQTDLERLRQQQQNSNHETTDNTNEEEGEKEAIGNNIAVIIKMKLGASQYATMALRELSRGGVVPYKPDFGAGR